MPTDVIPLGTSGAVPAHGRHLAACALRRGGRVFLFDCGEGTQYRLMHAGLRRSRIASVFITHLHGDHLYGLPGLLSTMALQDRTAPLTVVGPEGLRTAMQALPGLRDGALPFEVDYVEVGEGLEREVVFEDGGCTVEARPLKHRVFVMGFRYEEKVRPGRVDAARAEALGVEPRQIGALVRGEAVTTAAGRIVRPEEVVGPERPGVAVAYCLDTAPCDGARALADGADLLVHDATFAEEHAGRAAETGHSTARQAAEVARDAGARRLLLTHFSARYDDLAPLVEEARSVFENADAAEELRTYPVEPAA